MTVAIETIHEEAPLAQSPSKLVKINIFKATLIGNAPCQDELLLHRDDFPDLVEGDVVEIFCPDNESGDITHVPRFVVQITKNMIYPDNGGGKPVNKENVHIEKSLADTFSLKNYRDVWITKVDKRKFFLDSIELTFKDLYLGRSEMWRTKKSLENTVVHVQKKIEVCQGQIRCQVNEMWLGGYRMASGYVTSDTKVVFRSPTANVYLFIQMSREMWEVDSHGELYFEKACAFLSEMFNRWKESGSSHEVTIVLFSRCFYDVKNLNELPKDMQQCLQVGYNNRIFEDFYRVVVQNERFDDWTSTIRELNRIFTNYKSHILDYHTKREGVETPKPKLSRAAQGNFLEVLNMSLNTFENHYLNRNLDRTGQQIIVITPGVGIFEVDRQLTYITKQRIIDSGVGSDLICLGEQPIHAVPLLRFHHKNVDTNNDFSMPHWINLSFFSKGNKIGYSDYEPRIKTPSRVDREVVRNSVPLPELAEEDEEELHDRYKIIEPFIVDDGTLATQDHITIFDQLAKASFGEEPPDVDDLADDYDDDRFEYNNIGGAAGNRGQLPSSANESPIKRKLSDPQLRQDLDDEAGGIGIPGSSGGGGKDPARPGSINIPSGAGGATGLSRNRQDLLSPGSDDGIVFSSSLGNTNAANNNNTSGNLNQFMMRQQQQQQEAQSRRASNTGSTSVFGAAVPGTSAGSLSSRNNSIAAAMADNGIAGAAGGSSIMGSLIDTQFDHQAIKKFLLRPGRALVNPFDPNLTVVKLTSNSRRWTHIFPKGPSGQHQQLHHQPTSEILNQISQSALLTMNQTPSTPDKGAIPKRPHHQLHYHHHRHRKTSSSFSFKSNQTKDGTWPRSGRGSRSSVANGLDLVENSLLTPSTEESTWSPVKQTGVDWKSLTIPASLPLTTDYFPSDASLIKDYVVNFYELNPQEIFHGEATERSPLPNKNREMTNREVFDELISQRLAQGFQLILFANRKAASIDVEANNIVVAEVAAAATPPAAVKQSKGLASRFRRSSKTSLSSTNQITTVSPALPKLPAAVQWLSIERIFHKIALAADGSNIKVTSYRPKAPYEDQQIHYRYRFQAPDNDTYEVSWNDFKTEKLENFNWNLMDFYVCTHGDREYILTENLKYWRFRLYALPLTPYVPITKKIMENLKTRDTCDLYFSAIKSCECRDMVKGFTRFVEFCLNKIRRPASSGMKPQPVAALRGASSKGTRTPVGAVAGGIREQRSNTISVDRSQLTSAAKLRHPSGGGGGSASNNSSMGQLSPNQMVAAAAVAAVSAHTGSSTSVDKQATTIGSFEKQLSSPAGLVDLNLDVSTGSEAALALDPVGGGLCVTSTLGEIVEAMRSPEKGLTFLTKLQGLPLTTFISMEAVAWIMENVKGVDSQSVAIGVLNRMVEKKYVYHASGDLSHSFVYGFYFFAVNPNPKVRPTTAYNGNLETFRNDWVEVEIQVEDDKASKNKHGMSMSSGSSDLDMIEATAAAAAELPEFLSATMEKFVERQTRNQELAKKTFYKSMTFDPDQSNRSDRTEWGHLRYQRHYDPCSAFDFAVQWSVSSGAIISELVLGWARKAQQYGISLIPVPNDPFALPITKKSDPVRGPIFIELDTDCLMGDKEVNLFEDYPQRTWDQRLLLFREAIAQRFGFVNSRVDNSQQPSSSRFSTDHQYIHCTGNMFLLIPTRMEMSTGIQGMKVRQSIFEKPREATKSESSSESSLPNFDRHLSQKKPAYDHSETGFLWSWNFMISRKWKTMNSTGATGEIAFMDKMLEDFRKFCRNDNNRLLDFWNESLAMRKQSST